jgi:hypothetical protein
LLISPPSFSPKSCTEYPDVSKSHGEAHSLHFLGNPSKAEVSPLFFVAVLGINSDNFFRIKKGLLSLGKRYAVFLAISRTLFEMRMVKVPYL